MRFFYDYASRFTACVTSCLFCLSFSASAQAECPDDAAIALYLAAYAKGIPAAGFGPGLSDEDAECAKFKLVKQLPTSWSPPIFHFAVASKALKCLCKPRKPLPMP